MPCVKRNWLPSRKPLEEIVFGGSLDEPFFQ